MNDLERLMHEVATTAHQEIRRTHKQIDFILLDGSGSMAHRWLESLDAIDKYAAGIKAIETQMIMATFSSARGMDYSIVRETTSTAWRQLALEPPQCPGGGTPLYDAINIMVRSLRDMNPEKCSIVIVTDGEENGSRTTTAVQARALLDWCRGRGWEVTFIGCDFNNATMAKLLGASDESAIGAPTKRLTDITMELAKKRGYYDKFGTPMHFSDAEKRQFGGYLSDHTNGN